MCRARKLVAGSSDLGGFATNTLKHGTWATVAIPFGCSPWLTSFILAQTVMMALIPTFQLVVIARFLDTALSTLSTKADISAVYPSLLLLTIVVAYQWLMGVCIDLARRGLTCALRERFRTALTERRAEIEYRYVEDPAASDLIGRVSDAPEVKVGDGFANVCTALSLALRVGGLLVILVTQVWWTAAVVVVVSVPLFTLASRSGRATYQAKRETARSKRRYQYLSNVMTARDGADERFLFGYSTSLNDVWFREYETARKIELKAQARWFVKLKSGSITTVLISMTVAAVLLKPALAGRISIGMFFSIVNAAFALVHAMSWEMVRCIDAISSHREYLKDLSELADMERIPGVTDAPSSTPRFDTLVFEDVRFKYPNTEHYILDGLCLELHAGKHYAVVGVNGAGKTTIVKLLTGLYDDYEGRILLNGRDLRSYSQGELKSFYSVVYQDLARYHLTLRENVAIGDARGCDDQRIKEALRRLSLDEVVAALPHGLDTPLGKVKPGGQDISGGEWQRVALCRAVVSPAPIRILDEPTAALDPMAESRLYKDFGEMSTGKTTILISHRLGSTSLANEIVVIGDGRVQESGTHAELMAREGIYREMYESQRSWYR